MLLDYVIIKLSTNQLREHSNITKSQRGEGVSKMLMHDYERWGGGWPVIS